MTGFQLKTGVSELTVAPGEPLLPGNIVVGGLIAGVLAVEVFGEVATEVFTLPLAVPPLFANEFVGFPGEEVFGVGVDG